MLNPACIGPVSCHHEKNPSLCFGNEREWNIKDARAVGNAPLWVWRVTSENLTIFHVSLCPSEAQDELILFHHHSPFISAFIQEWCGSSKCALNPAAIPAADRNKWALVESWMFFLWHCITVFGNTCLYEHNTDPYVCRLGMLLCGGNTCYMLNSANYTLTSYKGYIHRKLFLKNVFKLKWIEMITQVCLAFLTAGSMFWN